MNGMPKPDENHAKLQRLAGTWTGEEKMNPSPWGPGGTAIGRYQCRMAVDGFFLIQDYVQETDGKPSYHGHGILGWDGEKKAFAWYWVDSMGQVPAAPSRGQWTGDTLVMEHEPMGGRRGRYTYQFSGDAALLFKIENSQDDGKSWQTFMEGKYRKG
jgi:hypothetical protein